MMVCIRIILRGDAVQYREYSTCEKGENVNITFLIGNGFDLGLGLKSKFTDYFPIYCNSVNGKGNKDKCLCNEIENNTKLWSDFEMQMGRYTKNFSAETKNLFVEQMRDFELGFIKYLKEDEKTICLSDTSQIEGKMKQALTQFYMQSTLHAESATILTETFRGHRDYGHTYNFISFNYTSLLEKCLETIDKGIVQKRKTSNMSDLVDKIGRIVHVHGSLDNHPIMGVNDAEQVENPELAKDERFLRYILKPEINQAIRMNYDNDAEMMILDSLIICVYGMSLGATDKMWWNKILNWLAGNEGRHLIIYDYDPDFVASTPYDWIRKEDEILDKLTSYSCQNIKAEKYRNRIHIAVHKNIFELNLRREFSSV